MKILIISHAPIWVIFQNSVTYAPNHKKYDELRIHLLKKWGDGSTGTGTGIRVTLRLPDGTKVRVVVDENCTTKVSNLYNTCIANNNYCIMFYNT